MSRSWAGGSTRRWRRVRELVLARDGHRCQVPKGAGICGERATHVDHIRPLADGGDKWDMSNMRAACAPCNLSRGTSARAAGPTVAVYVVIGPPGGGKSSYVREYAHAGDIVIDLDALAAALQVPDSMSEIFHSYPQHVRHVAIGARAAAIRRAVALAAGTCRVWIIHAVPSVAQLREYVASGWDVVVVDPGPELTRQRIAASDRQSRHHDAGDNWYRMREQLLAALERTEEWAW